MDSIFKAYDIRATYPDQINEEIAWRIGHATAQFFRSQLTGYARSDPKQNVLAVGRDMRKSGPGLCKAFIEGALSAGMNCIDIGMIDTSQIYFAVNFLQTAGGVQTTATTIPDLQDLRSRSGWKARAGIPGLQESTDRHGRAAEKFGAAAS